MNALVDKLFTETKKRYDLPDAEIEYFPEFFSQEESLFFLSRLLESIKWKQNTIKMYGKENPVPRLEAWYGDPGKSYAYSGIHMEPIPWTDELMKIKASIESEASILFNSVLINHYRNGQDRVAWHSDDEKELKAAKAAGIRHAIMTIRPGNAPLTSDGKKEFPQIFSLLQLCGA